MRLKCYEAMADAFVDEGADVVFSVMGDANYMFLAALEERSDVRIVWARHENAALAMADGYASASGRVGVCALTYGPGLTSAVTSLFTSQRRGVPLVAFVGDTPAGHTINAVKHEALVACTDALWQPVDRPMTAVADVHQAFARARTAVTPLVLNVPKELQDEPYPDDAPAALIAASPGGRVDPALPEADVVDDVARKLEAAERVVVLVGRGAIGRETLVATVRLGERVGAVFATTILAQGAFAGHPLNAGVAGLHSTAAAVEAFAQADCLALLGAGSHIPGIIAMFPEAEIVHLDRSAPSSGSRRYDSLHSVQALNERLATDRRRHASGWPASLLERLGERSPLSGPAVPAGECDPRLVVRELDDLLPPSSLVVLGAGHFADFVLLELTRPKQFPFIFSTSLDLGGAIGQGLPVAIGAALARPGTPLVLFEGDASLMMYLAELHTAARHALNLLVVVMNDDGLGAEFHKLRAMGVNPAGALMDNPDLGEVASALGVPGLTVTDPAQLKPAVDRFLGEPGPLLINAIISREVTSPAFQHLHHDVFGGRP
jgi:thiamine pyrophosphate-dependent acetolactate synthase large subunit-like protein